MRAKLTSNPEKAHTPISVKFCLRMAGTYSLKILLNRGKVIAAPFGVHSDAYQSKMVKPGALSVTEDYCKESNFKSKKKTC
jgi:hypothetical protein